MIDLPFPKAGISEGTVDGFEARGEAGVQQIVGHAPDGLFRIPAIEVLRAEIPGFDDAFRIADDDCIVSQVDDRARTARAGEPVSNGSAGSALAGRLQAGLRKETREIRIRDGR